jgi:hypothetical protein
MLSRTRLGLFMLVAAGCGGGGGVRNDGGRAGVGGGGRDGGTFNPFDAAMAVEVPPPDRGTANPGASVFQGGDASLLGAGPSCTGEEGATGDRWCGFATSLTVVGNAYLQFDLYVVNVTRAAAGTAITCGQAGDTNCLKLATAAREDDFHGTFFQGDTLVYYDSTWTPLAWRPGMTAGRALAVADPTMADVFGCVPATMGNAIACLRDLPAAMQPDPTNIIISELLVGRLDATATPPLALVENLISANRADGNVGRFAYSFLPGGDSVAWSARMTAGGPEILKLQRVGDNASRVTVGSDVHDWSVSPDGTHWTWYSAFSAASGSGALQSAAYPAGTGPVANGTNIVQYAFPNPRALVTVNSTGAMAGIAEPLTAPSTTSPIDTGVIAFLEVSSQGDVGYVKNFDGFDLVDLYVKRWNSTSAACTLTSTVTAPFAAFLFMPGGGGAVWGRSTGTDFQLQFTRVSDCMTMQVASSFFSVNAASDRGIVYMEGFENATGTGSLWFRPLTGGNTVGGDATYVASQVGTFDVVPAATSALIYSVNGGGNADGIYVRSGP